MYHFEGFQGLNANLNHSMSHNSVSLFEPFTEEKSSAKKLNSFSYFSAHELLSATNLYTTVEEAILQTKCSSLQYTDSTQRSMNSAHLLVQSQQYKYQKRVQNMFEANNKKYQNNITYAVLVFLLLTLNIFHTFFQCFSC